jgi:hypothetical protein
MPDTHILLDPPAAVPVPVAVPLQPGAGAAGVAAIAPVADAFRIRFRAHQTDHTLPYLDTDGRGANGPDVVLVQSRSGQPAPAGINRGGFQPDALDAAADTRVTHVSLGAPTDWRLNATGGTPPVQWPVGYKEPPIAAPLDMDSVANQTRRYVCHMAAVYGIHRANCGICGNRHVGVEETPASKALCDQFAVQLQAQWLTWRTFWTNKAWFLAQIPNPAGLPPQRPRHLVLRSNFNHADWAAALPRAIAIRNQLGLAAPAVDPFAAAPANAAQAQAKGVAIPAMTAMPTVTPTGKFMIGVMIVTMGGGVVRRYAAVSGGEAPASQSDMAKRNLGDAASQALVPAVTYATRAPAAQPVVDWAGAPVALTAPANPGDNLLGNCAAPKMLHAFYAAVAAANRAHPAQVMNVEITEQWFDPIVPDQADAWHGLTEPSCRTCQRQVPELLCGY